jgi:tetratricopeptide (TPR) repeat protein
MIHGLDSNSGEVIAMRWFPLCVMLLSALSASGQTVHVHGDEPAAAITADVGEVSFENSGGPAAQLPFRHGLALLHNFEYPAAAEAFRQAQKADPSFAMAYWGEAMTYTHPVWFQQDADAARAVLMRLAPTADARIARGGTERERAYLQTVEVLYGAGEKNERDFKYSDAMAALHARYPDDIDATAFYALSILGTAHEGRDFATYMRAAALLEEVFPAHMQHPGVLHYLIHCYDDPVHAPLGMRAAKLYGAIAPNAGHALHMTSHIFMALGMWDDVIAANIKAIAVVDRRRMLKNLPLSHCDHYSTWLHYGYLQTGRYADATKSLDACRQSAFPDKFVASGPMDSLQGRVDEYVAMRSQQLASGAMLAAGDESVVITDSPELAEDRLELAYGDVLAAAVRGDVAALRAKSAAVHALEPAALALVAKESSGQVSRRTAIALMAQESDALLRIAEGKRADGIAILQSAVKTEQAMPLEFGPPVVAMPPSEMLAEQLLLAGRTADAEAAYRTALERTPGRTPALRGLLRAQKAAGHVEAAATTQLLLEKYRVK